MMNEKTGEVTKKTNSQIFSDIARRGSLFNYYGKEYFTIGIDDKFNIYCCLKGSSVLEVTKISYDALFEAIEKKKTEILVDEDYLLVDEDLLKDDELEEYIALKSAMDEIVREYSPDFSYLESKTNKTHLKELAKKCGLPYRKFRQVITRFFTSGLKYYALLSKRSNAFGDRRKRNKPYNYTKKTGRKVRDSEGKVIEQGIIIDKKTKEDILAYTDLINQGLTVPQAFNRYNAKLNVKDNPYNDGNLLLVEKDKRPTFSQFRYIIENALGNKDKIIGRKGYVGYYNDHRPLTGDSLTNTSFPGDIVEIDAWEADISLVKTNQPDQVIGRPTIYLMVDRYTRMIVAFYVGFEVNSYQGLTSLFINLVDDKAEIFNKYGINVEREKIPLPEPFLPNLVVTDNGSDFKSKKFKDVLSSLGIEHEIAPPAAGSAKGTVERTFGEFALDHKDVFKGCGLIKKEYGSKHHEEATLNVDDYIRLFLLAIVKHNFKQMTNYPVHDTDLLDKNIDLSPFSLWQYYTKEKMQNPKSILDKESFYFNLMQRVKVSLNRNGLVFKGLEYDLGNNQKLLKLQEREKTKHLDFRLDPRDITRLYYQDEAKLMWCELNPNKAVNKPFFGLSLREFIDVQKQIKDKKREAIELNENLNATTTLLTDHLVKESVEEKKRNTFDKNKVKDIRVNRKEEKYERANEEKIANKLEDKLVEEVKEDVDTNSMYSMTYEDFLVEMENSY